MDIKSKETTVSLIFSHDGMKDTSYLTTIFLSTDDLRRLPTTTHRAVLATTARHGRVLAAATRHRRVLAAVAAHRVLAAARILAAAAATLHLTHSI